MMFTTGSFLITIGLFWLQLATSSGYVPRTRSEGGCPSAEWAGPFRSTCYKLSEDYKSWTEANSAGCGEGTYLAPITYDNKAFLSKQMSIIKSTYYWVGLRSGDGDGDSSAADALRLNYTNWERMRHHEPSGSRASNDDCVLMVGDAAPKEFLPAGSWIDWDCNYATKFICQKEISNNCPEEWERPASGGYIIPEKTASFSDAEAYCVERDAKLATVTDYKELSDSLQLDDLSYFWVGLRSTPAQDGKLYWLSGQEATPTNWKFVQYDEPDAAHFGANADCVVVNGIQSDELYTVGKWSDYFCDVEYRFLCAIDV